MIALHPLMGHGSCFTYGFEASFYLPGILEARSIRALNFMVDPVVGGGTAGYGSGRSSRVACPRSTACYVLIRLNV